MRNHVDLDIGAWGIAIVYDSCIQNDTMQNNALSMLI